VLDATVQGHAATLGFSDLQGGVVSRLRMLNLVAYEANGGLPRAILL